MIDTLPPHIDFEKVEQAAKAKVEKDRLKLFRRSMTEMTTEHRKRRPAVIDGIARRGEVVNLIGASKQGKSMLGYSMAYSVLNGTKWLGLFDTHGGDVLLIDSELNDEEIGHRNGEIKDSLVVAVNREMTDRFGVVTVAHEDASIDDIVFDIDNVVTPDTSLILLDSLYVLLPDDVDENSNNQMTRQMRKLIRVAQRLNVCIVIIHHSSKGVQTGKEVTDIGSGAGAMARATGSHIVVLPHEKGDEYAVLEGKCRSFPSIDQVTLRFRWPNWTSDQTVRPEKKKTGRKQQEEDDAIADKKVIDAMEMIGHPTTAYKLREPTGLGAGRVNRCLSRLLEMDAIEMAGETSRGAILYRLLAEFSSGSNPPE